MRDYFDPLPIGARTIAHDLADVGYRTAFWGKWHLAKRDREAALVGEVHARMIVAAESRGGFQFWEGFESGFLLNDPWLHGSDLARPVQFAGYQSDVLGERAARWMAGQTGPWFTMVSLESPHPPYLAPVPPGGQCYRAEDLVLAENVSSDEAVRQRVRSELAGYYAHIEATDRALGQLVARMEANTIIVVTSVHGDMHGAHGKFRKGWPFEESVRVPFVVRSAPGWSAGTTNDAAVSLVDLPAMTRAWSRGEAWTCPRAQAPLSMPSVVALADQGDRVWSGWRSATRKEIFGADGQPWLSFDLEADPLERNNLV